MPEGAAHDALGYTNTSRVTLQHQRVDTGSGGQGREGVSSAMSSCYMPIRATSLQQSVQSLTLTALKQILSMTQPCTGWRPQPTQWCRTHYTLPPCAPILSTTYTRFFCIHDFSTPTYGRLFALKMAITSSDIGSCGYHGSWEQVARITVLRQPT